MNIKFFIIILVCLLANARQGFTEEIYLGNKLRSVHEQLNDLRKECKYQEDNEACLQEIKRLKSSRVKLLKLCQKTPQDPLCTHISQIKKEQLDDLKIFCMKRPFERKCQEKKERIKEKQKICEKNPQSPSCQIAAPKKPKSYDELLEFCKINPRSKVCDKLNQTDSDRKQKEQSQKGLSTF